MRVVPSEQIPQFTDYGADAGTRRRCQHCGAHVTPNVARVLEPEGEAGPRACPHCPDRVRDGGEIREARSFAGTEGEQV